MKRILFVILTVLLVSTSAFATVNYVDVAGGNDTTGDGSAGNPYATIEKADDGLGGGDEVRVAKTDPIALSGTLTFTNGSTSISTSADLTGELSANDFIGKDDGWDEGWWKVSSVTSDTITLEKEYWGSSETTSAYVSDPVELYDQDLSTATDGDSAVSMLKITGGWNLSTETRTGLTHLWMDATAAFFDRQSTQYVEIAYFVFLDAGYQGLAGSAYHHYTHHICESSSYWYGSEIGKEDCVIENYVVAGNQNYGLMLSLDESFRCKVSDSYIYSVGSGSSDYALYIACHGQYGIIFDNVKVYNGYVNLGFGASVQGIYFKDCVFDTTQVYDSVYDAGYTTEATFVDCEFKNAVDDGFGAYATATGNFRLIRPIFSGNGGADIEMPTGYNQKLCTPTVFVEDFNGTANDDRMYFIGGIVYKDSTDARTGYCLKFDPDAQDGGDNDFEMVYKIGTVQIESAASDLDLSFYAKKDGSFDGTLYAWAVVNGVVVTDISELFSLTTSYVKQTVTVDSADLTVGKFAELWVSVNGSAGNAFIDDFEAANQ